MWDIYKTYINQMQQIGVQLFMSHLVQKATERVIKSLKPITFN